MITYRVCDLVLQSDLPFPELSPTAQEGADYTFRVVGEKRQTPRRWLWQHRLPDGQLYLSCLRHSEGCLLRYPNVADFVIGDTATEIRCWPVPNVSLEAIRHLLLNQVLPLALQERGRVVLHASAFVGPQGAVAFLGETGRGKSTLAGSFCSEGFPLLTDDCLLLEDKQQRILGVPSYPTLRLWPDVVDALSLPDPLTFQSVETRKWRVSTGAAPLPFHDRPASLRQLYVLAEPEISATDTIKIVPLSPRAALIELIKHSYRLELTDRARIAQEFDRLTSLAKVLPMARLIFPRALSSLPAIRAAVLRDLDDHGSRGQAG